MQLHYLIIKEKDKKEIAYFESNNLKGFNMTSKNKKIKLKDAVNVNKMVIINPSFVSKVVNKRINSKIQKLIDMLANIYDTESDDPAGALMLALNEVEKFKREMINKYVDYMTKEEIKLLDKKIKILEYQVTSHAYMLNERYYEEERKTK